MSKVKEELSFWGVCLFIWLGTFIVIAIGFWTSPKYDDIYNDGYDAGYNEAIIGQYEDILDLLIENAILEERLRNKPSNEKYIKQIVDDFELLLELQQYYYQENITSHSFGDWIQINYPKLYERIRSYF